MRSATVAMNQIIQEKQRQGQQVFNFAAGDPELAVHPSIVQAARRHLDQGQSRYPPVEGIQELRVLACRWMNNFYQTHYAENQVLVTSGAKFALVALMQALLEPGDEVLLAAPYWVSYPAIVRLAGGICKVIPTSQQGGWKLTAKAISANVTERTKLVIVNNPCNPTGVLYTRQELAEILQAAQAAGIGVVADEVYSGLVYDSQQFVSCGSFLEHQEHVYVVQSCSKNFAMPGWRVGFLFGSSATLKSVSAILSQTITGTALCSQWAAVGALENAAEVIAYVREAMEKRRDCFVSTYNSLFEKKIEKPPAGLYAFIKVEGESAALCEDIALRLHVGTAAGSAFGTEGYIRFAFSAGETEIIQGLNRLKQGGVL